MRTLVLIACLLAASCSNLAYEGAAGRTGASGSGRTAASTAGRAPIPASHTVRSGETLYSIAFRYGLDQRSLAAWNGLANPDRIRVGQRLVLSPPAGSSRSAPTSASTASSGRPANSGSAAASPPRSTTAASASPPARPTAGPSAWVWPVRGRVVARFGDRGVLSTGIGIAGQLGQDVVAAAAGRVVYVGSGLPDYGQLVIIEHDATWLSAYGHNRVLLVTEGQSVTRGQKIAEMGPGPGGEPRLHFEIRRNGDPIDPLGLLPASG